MATMTDVSSCTTTSCAFNHDGCAAVAVTIIDADDAAECGTFIALDARGGLPTASAHVGACQRTDCAHNEDLLCTAGAIRVGGHAGHEADCLTFTAR